MRLKFHSNKVLPCLAAVAALLAGGAMLGGQSQSDLIELELQMSDDLGQWTGVEIQEGHIEPNGILTIPFSSVPLDEEGFFRMSVGIVPEGEYLEDAPIGNFETPAGPAFEVAGRFLEDFTGAGGWPAGSRVRDIAVPLYNPAINDGDGPAYVEFAVTTEGDLGESQEGAYGDSAQDLPAVQDAGYIIVSLTAQDSPIAAFSTTGLPPSQQLIELTDTRKISRVQFYDESFIVAEDANGEALGFLGSEPIRLPPELNELPHFEREGFDEDPPEDFNPLEEGRPYESYLHFKDAYLGNEFYARERAEQALQAQLLWRAERGELEDLVEVFPPDGELHVPGSDWLPSGFVPNEETELTFDAGEVFPEDGEETGDGPFPDHFAVEDGRIVISSRVPVGGVLRVRDRAGDLVALIPIVFVDESAAQPQQTFGWTPWNYWGISGSTPTQGQYSWLTHCSASGCGPTAWAILYGWWDNHGRPGVLGSPNLADAPNGSWSGYHDCIQYTFNRMNTFCILQQAGTWPWLMTDGRFWANQERGVGYYYRYSWEGPPNNRAGTWKVARSSIKNEGEPAILGIGAYSHYVVAEHYAVRYYKSFGQTTLTARYFRSNWGGWSGNRNWHKAGDTFFGMTLDMD